MWARVTSVLVVVVGCGGEPSSPVDSGSAVDAPAADVPAVDAPVDAAADGAGLVDAPSDAAPPPPPPPLPDWARRYGTFTANGAPFNSPADAIQATDRGYVLADTSQWVLGLETNGERRWDIAIPGVRLHAVGELPSGDVVLLADEDSPEDAAFFRIVLAPDGSVRSQTRYGSSAQQRILSTASFRADGSVVAHGLLRQLGTDRTVSWLVSISDDGTIVWERRVTAASVTIEAVSVRPSGGFAIAGVDGADPWVAAADDSGAIEWSRSFGGAFITRVVDLAPRLDGGWIVLAETTALGAGTFDVWVVAFDRFGAIEWQRAYGSAADDRAATIAVRDDGYTFSGILDGRAWLVGLASDGAVRWERTYTPPNAVMRSMHAVATDDGGSLIAAGIAPIESFFAPTDLWVLHVDAEGMAEACAVVETPMPSVTSSTSETAVDFAVELELSESHAATDAVLAPEPTESYVDVHCGAGESTPWGAAGFLETCTCSGGRLCVGPTTGCGHDLTCVGRTTSARCSVRCGTDDNCPSGGCSVISVDGTNLGAWCQ